MTIALGLSMISNAQPVKQSAYFDGSNYITTTTAGDPINANNNPTMTIEAWVKKSRDTTTKQTILYIPAIVTGTAIARPVIDIHILNDSVYATYGDTLYVAAQLTHDTLWHHIAFICDTISSKDKYSIYIDGTFKNQLIQNHHASNTGGEPNFNIGAKHNMGTTVINDYFKGHICNVVITDSILYTSNFTPDCIYDTTHIIANKCIFPTLLVAPLNTNDNIYDTSGTLLYGIYVSHTNTSPCMPVYTYSVDTTTYIDSVLLFAHNTNASFNKGSYVPHTINGWNGVLLLTATYGLFTDTLIISITDTVIYVDDNGDTTKHSGNKSLTSHVGINNLYNNTHINIYPNPSTGTIYVSSPAKIVVYDMTGKCILNEYVMQSFNISTGLYICVVNGTTYKLSIH